MAKTQAQRAKEYRGRKRDAGNVSASEPARHESDENVTKQECDAPGVSSRKKQTFKDLPADVQASIESGTAAPTLRQPRGDDKVIVEDYASDCTSAPAPSGPPTPEAIACLWTRRSWRPAVHAARP